MLMSDNCSVVAVTFMSRDLWNHVLCRVRHLVNIIVVFLETHVFSSLEKLLHLATRIKVIKNKIKKIIKTTFIHLCEFFHYSCAQKQTSDSLLS